MRLLLAARLSHLQSNGREGIGLDTQESKSKEFAERNGYEIVHVAADTKSGRHGGRHCQAARRLPADDLPDARAGGGG